MFAMLPFFVGCALMAETGSAAWAILFVTVAWFLGAAIHMRWVPLIRR